LASQMSWALSRRSRAASAVTFGKAHERAGGYCSRTPRSNRLDHLTPERAAAGRGCPVALAG
jgi:hypothetical protein